MISRPGLRSWKVCEQSLLGNETSKEGVCKRALKHKKSEVAENAKASLPDTLKNSKTKPGPFHDKNTMITKAKALEIRVLPRGNWLDAGEVVLIPEFMGVQSKKKQTVWIVSIWRSG